MTEDLRQQAILLYDRFTHDGMDRRLFMGRMVALAGSVAAAEALIGAIAASPAAARVERTIVRPGHRDRVIPGAGMVWSSRASA